MPSSHQKQTAANVEDLTPRTARLHEVAVPAHSRIGLELRGARVRRGESVAGVAQALRIRQIHLQALEDGRFGDLPGRAYVVGFLKTYGGYLGLDGDALVERFRNESGGLDAPAELNFPEPLSAPSLPTGRLVFGALALAVVVFAGWYLLQERENQTPAAVATVVTTEEAASGQAAAESDATATEATTAAVAEDSAAAENDTAPAEDGAALAEDDAAPAENAVATVMEPSAYAPPEPAAIEVAPAPDVSAVAEATEDEVVAPEPTVVPAEEEVAASVSADAETVAAATEAGAGDDYVPQTFGRGNADSRVKLRALGDAWVQISGPDGELLLTRILQVGDVYMIPNQPGLSLVTGNAGGLEVSVDGVPVSALGAVGEVRRGVSLDPERLKAGG